jgi:hypothetical protein
MNLRVSAEDAGWQIREAAWDLEERVIWRGSDASRRALRRVGAPLKPLQRRVQTRLTWPLADALRRRSAATRVALATGTAVVALGAAAGGAVIAAQHSSTESLSRPLAPASVTPARESSAPALQGVTPHFQPAEAEAPPAPAPAASKPTAPPAQVAWRFAQAFVTYEVGRSGDRTDAVFADTATKQLAKSLAADPPRLPSHGKVPQARVLNVVLGDQTKNQISASVSLVRLRATSEVRLMLMRAGNQWRVAQVLG